MQVDHAVATTPDGPFIRADVALPAPATNPQAIRRTKFSTTRR